MEADFLRGKCVSCLLYTSKHTDDGETKIETPEKGASFEIYLKSAGSYDAANKDESS